jgi:hypothetical protein
MREAFETAPRDGKVVILEDDASGTYEAARWSAEAGEWVGEDGEPSNITPTHWYPYSFLPFSSSKAPPQPSAADDAVAPRSVVASAPVTLEAFETQTARVEANPTPHERRRFAASSITATLDRYAGRYGMFEISMMGIFGISMVGIIGIAMMGWQVAEQATQLPSDSEPSSYSRDIAPQQRTESDQATAQAHAQVKQAVEAIAPQARQSLENEQRPEALANELADARGAVNELNQQLEAAAANSAQLLGQERDKAAALLQDATAARQERAASMVQHRQAIDEERAHSAALASELAMARREIETQAASLRKAGDQATLLKQAGDEAVQLKQAAESATAELRQSLQQERDRAEAMARDLESARRTIDGRAALERSANSQSTAQATQAVEAGASGQPAAAVSQGSPEAARLMARASALLGQGNIGAARIVLERAAETGSAKASFALAETYDPVILSAWRAYGTRGDATKAREFYAKARAGGISEAKDRFNALR